MKNKKMAKPKVRIDDRNKVKNIFENGVTMVFDSNKSQWSVTPSNKGKFKPEDVLDIISDVLISKLVNTDYPLPEERFDSIHINMKEIDFTL
ncbi:MAG: hypothetical protein ABJQ37_19970 [Reichenbachiella sp.]|uniref:hypothetical protein n=1 Tax=Reichenbachiella sp. TaxID=2184521 RepID=UPI003296DA60